MLYAILSDIHANYQALLAVETYLDRLRTYTGKEIGYWFLGDIVGYGPEPTECLAWLWRKFHQNPHWVVGNHDQEVVWLAQAYERTGRCSVDTENATKPGYTDEALISWQIHSQQLPEDTRRWQWFTEKVAQATTQQAHDLVHIGVDDLNCILVHGSIDSITRRTTYLYPWYPHLILSDLQSVRLAHLDMPITLLLHGHSHYPHIASLGASDKVEFHSIRYGIPFLLDKRVYAINPGSIGQPRDGDPRAAFALLDTNAHTITYHRVMYNVLDSMRKLELGGYPQSLVERLESADGKENLLRYRTVYTTPRLDQLLTVDKI